MRRIRDPDHGGAHRVEEDEPYRSALLIQLAYQNLRGGLSKVMEQDGGGRIGPGAAVLAVTSLSFCMTPDVFPQDRVGSRPGGEDLEVSLIDGCVRG